MAELPTPEVAARKVLDVCSEFKVRPGNALPERPLQHRLLVQGVLTSDELAGGVNYGKEQGWFEETDDGRLLLTEAGFSAM